LIILSKVNDIQTMNAIKWPYPVQYGKTHEIECDVLCLGGGVGGCYAAMAADDAGVKVVVVDEGPIIRSGSAGTGFDHWHSVATNPCSKVTPAELTEIYRTPRGWFHGPFSVSHVRFIEAMESWDCLLTAEKIGVPIRDYDDHFKDSIWRDDKTKLMFAYDVDKNHCIRFKRGAIFKPQLKVELDRRGIEQYEYVCATSLLTEDGKQGGRVIGATGVSIRTGEFYVFKAKTVILGMGQPTQNWKFHTELNGSASGFFDPNWTGDGAYMALKAGAKMMNMEQNDTFTEPGGGFRRPMYGVGDVHNTWYGAIIVDANGKAVPYVDAEGNEIPPDEYERLYHGGWTYEHGDDLRLTPRLAEGLKTGEWVLPLYADLTQMDPLERDALWGIMVGNEGKTNYPVLKMYNKYGFDPSKDMLEVVTRNNLEDYGLPEAWWELETWERWRSPSCGCLQFVDWNLRTSLEGLYAIGFGIGTNMAAGACTTGRYAARNAAKYSMNVDAVPVDQAQVEAEKNRVYKFAQRTEGMGWKECRAGMARVMQDYCSVTKGEAVFNKGLTWLDTIEANELNTLYARNPHELVRCIETENMLLVDRAILEASKARKHSNPWLSFYRVDYPEMPEEKDYTYSMTHMEGDKWVVEEIPLRWYLQGPYADNYEDNYDACSAIDDED